MTLTQKQLSDLQARAMASNDDDLYMRYLQELMHANNLCPDESEFEDLDDDMDHPNYDNPVHPSVDGMDFDGMKEEDL